jgi:hypothetical protein
MGRIACILVPDFPLASLIRANPELEGTPLVLGEALTAHAEVVAAAPQARAVGQTRNCDRHGKERIAGGREGRKRR